LLISQDDFRLRPGTTTCLKVHKNETPKTIFNLLKPTGYVSHQQFNIQQLYALRTLYLCVLYSSEIKRRLVPLTA